MPWGPRLLSWFSRCIPMLSFVLYLQLGWPFVLLYSYISWKINHICFFPLCNVIIIHTHIFVYIYIYIYLFAGKPPLMVSTLNFIHIFNDISGHCHRHRGPKVMLKCSGLSDPATLRQRGFNDLWTFNRKERICWTCHGKSLDKW